MLKPIFIYIEAHIYHENKKLVVEKESPVELDPIT